jgi:hypothetical protein
MLKAAVRLSLSSIANTSRQEVRLVFATKQRRGVFAKEMLDEMGGRLGLSPTRGF